jgi:hypothetical protein
LIEEADADAAGGDGAGEDKDMPLYDVGGFGGGGNVIT